MMLEVANPLPGDERITFEKRSHTYTVDGHLVPKSVTRLIDDAIPEELRFDKERVFHANIEKWRSNASNKYHALVTGKSDEDAFKAVSKSWDDNADAGTALHAELERVCNGVPPDDPIRFEVELQQFEAIRAQKRHLVPFRTELSLFAVGSDGLPKLAGQIDLLARTQDGKYVIVDFKRVDKDLSPHAHSFGKKFLNGRPLNAHHQYSLQVSLYAMLLQLQTGIVASEAHILQVHPRLDRARFTRATDLREEARALIVGLGVDCPPPG